MLGAFDARPICQHSLPAAVAVLRLGVPDATLKSCRPLCQRDRNGRPKQGALIGVFDQRDYVHAVFRSLVEPSLPQGQRMKIYDLIIADSIAERMIVAMVEALANYARASACDTLTVAAPHIPGANSVPLQAILAGCGFDSHGLLMGRRL